MSTYIAIVHRTAKGYHATFPDFPLLELKESSLDNIRMEAQGMLEEHLATAGFEESGKRKVLTLDEVAGLPHAKGPDVVLLALTVQTPASKAVRINITIAENLLQAVDRSAAAHAMSRSRFLARAVESMVTGKRHQGIQIPLRDEVLEALDKAAEVHKMNRIPFLTGIIEVSLGLRRGHHNGLRIHLKDEVLDAVDQAAAAHAMERLPFITHLVEVGVGLHKRHERKKS